MFQQAINFDLPHNGTATSRAAADSMVPHVGKQEQTVIDCLKEHGPLHREAIAFLTGCKESSLCARLSALEARSLVRKSDSVAKTTSGRMAFIYEAIQ